MLQAYFDESGITADSKCCVVMGFVGTSQQWSRFGQGWMLATDGIPFHAKRFLGRDPRGQRLDQFQGWSDERASKYLRGILRVITSRIGQGAITPTGAIVDVAAFNALSRTERQYLTGCFLDGRKRMIGTGAPSKPYFAAFVQCVIQAKYARRDAVVDFVLDRNESFAPLAEKQFKVIAAHAEEDFARRLGSIAFKKSDEIAALQAADLAAYCLYQQSIGGYSRKHDLLNAVEHLGDIFHESKGTLTTFNHRNLKKVLSTSKASMALRTLEDSQLAKQEHRVAANGVPRRARKRRL